jgi:PPK2 family polyphosphate:nucleotide phosphotransferase
MYTSRVTSGSGEKLQHRGSILLGQFVVSVVSHVADHPTGALPCSAGATTDGYHSTPKHASDGVCSPFWRGPLRTGVQRMDYRKEFRVKPGATVKLEAIDAGYRGKHVDEDAAKSEIEKYKDKLCRLQYLMYSERKHSLLIVLQALDAGGKDGTVNHVMSVMNPQGTTVTGFKSPTAEDLQHDFLWRIHPHAPAKGAVAIFNRSHYEDVLVVRVHKLVPKEVWQERFALINDFEDLLYRQNNTHIIKFFLHISKDEQLKRFEQRLDDPARNWKISESDYKEREFWDDYIKAFEDVLERTSTKHAPWYVIPSNCKWFRNLAVSQIVVESMEELGMRMPSPQVDLNLIREEYHRAESQESHPDRRHGKQKKQRRKRGSGRQR